MQLHLGFLEQPQCLGDSEGANPVVESPGHGEVIAQQVEFVGQRDRVADAHQLLGFFTAGDADVNEQVVNLGRLGVLLLLHQMRSHVADDAFDGAIAGVNDHALGLRDSGVHAAHFADVYEALAVDVIDGHGDLVRVAGEHEPRRTALVEYGDTVAVSVGERLVGELCGIIQPGPLAASLVSDGAGRVNQCS